MNNKNISITHHRWRRRFRVGLHNIDNCDYYCPMWYCIVFFFSHSQYSFNYFILFRINVLRYCRLVNFNVSKGIDDRPRGARDADDGERLTDGQQLYNIPNRRRTRSIIFYYFFISPGGRLTRRFEIVRKTSLLPHIKTVRTTSHSFHRRRLVYILLLLLVCTYPILYYYLRI